MNSKIFGVATCVHTYDDYTIVRYHNTDVFSISQDGTHVVLDSGGYDTATTKRRMNQAFDAFGLEYRVYQDNFDWYVVKIGDWDNPVPFFDGIRLEVK